MAAGKDGRPRTKHRHAVGYINFGIQNNLKSLSRLANPMVSMDVLVQTQNQGLEKQIVTDFGMFRSKLTMLGQRWNMHKSFPPKERTCGHAQTENWRT
jgi:hypothetical protein